MALSVNSALWCSSYLGRRPFKIKMASSMDGASTLTAWKRRSSAASFSMYLRYSFSVVAPMHCISPRLRAGLMMFEASIVPSAEPAPTMVCNSSMNKMMFLERRISSMTALMRSSNWPRYLVPATMSARSSVMTRLSRSNSGTLPAAISCARPSTMAVLPTPASPSSTGLFLVRRQRIWMTRSISFLRPMTGSISPLRAISVRSRPNALSAGVLISPFFSGAGFLQGFHRRLILPGPRSWGRVPSGSPAGSVRYPHRGS